MLYVLDPFRTKQNFVCFANKSVSRKSFLVQRIFSWPKFSQLSPKFKDAVERIWRHTMFCQATISFFPWQLSFVRSSYFADMTLRQKTLHVSDASKVAKTKNCCERNSVFCHSAKRALVQWCSMSKSFINPSLGNFAKNCVLNLVKPFSGHFHAIKSQNLL